MEGTRAEIYLDNAATTRASAEVAAEVSRCLLEAYGNPSSLHPKGIEAEEVVDRAARAVASALGGGKSNIVFTSGGTEANNLAIFGAVSWRRRPGARIISSRIEHPSVFNTVKELESLGFEVVFAGVDRDGVIDLDEFRGLLTPATVLVSVMHVNNETGAVQPLDAIAAAVRACDGKPLLHVDAVQSLGHVPFRPQDSGVDLASVSAHKVHGPKGVGALWIRDGVRLRPIIYGGGQQHSIRSGTENVPGISGFGVACSQIAADPGFAERELGPIRETLARRIESEIPDAALLSPRHGAAPHILNVAFRGVKGEVLVRMLGSRGVHVSTGAACSSRKGETSRVLEAMGVPRDLAVGSIRLSLGRYNSLAEVDTVTGHLKEVVAGLRGFHR
ncbi:MAG: cysteine desulfurase [Firmicutes bacterium]|nr:cysteine desulfurase [Bacillota bacterium]